MAIVTIQTLASFTFTFQDSLTDRINEIIAANEDDYLNKALSPQLAEVFKADPDDARFESIRNGWIDDNNISQKGLDYGINNWCYYFILKDKSLNTIDGKISAATSDNKKRLPSDMALGFEIWNKAARVSIELNKKLESEPESFPEFTNGECIKLRTFFR